MRKLIILVIIVLFIGVNVVPIVSSNVLPTIYTNSGKTLYVGGSGAENCYSIQSAIDNANEGDVVFVYSGIYYENIKIKKSIHLIGKNKNNTIIDGKGSGDVITVYADNVEINGFTIRSAGELIQIGICIKNVQNCFVVNNIIKDNIFGISFGNSSSNNLIVSNYLTNNKWEGINVKGQDNNIYDNIVEKNGVGIDLSSSSHGYIIRNEITSNSINALELWHSEKNTITNNHIHGGTQLLYSCYNTFYNNEIDGRFYITYFSNHTTIIYNNMYESFNNYGYSGSYYNNWDRNYWYKWPIFLPRPIRGTYDLGKTHCFTFDWHPAKEPYDIP